MTVDFLRQVSYGIPGAWTKKLNGELVFQFRSIPMEVHFSERIMMMVESPGQIMRDALWKRIDYFGTLKPWEMMDAIEAWGINDR